MPRFCFVHFSNKAAQLTELFLKFAQKLGSEHAKRTLVELKNGDNFMCDHVLMALLKTWKEMEAEGLSGGKGPGDPISSNWEGSLRLNWEKLDSSIGLEFGHLQDGKAYILIDSEPADALPLMLEIASTNGDWSCQDLGSEADPDPKAEEHPAEFWDRQP